jgi:primosomal protein N' (replication factor Y)
VYIEHDKDECMNQDQQNQLFDTAPEPWQLDDQGDWVAARIVFSEAPYGPYDYSIPDSMQSVLKSGMRVKVPLGRGNRKMIGYCTDVITCNHPLGPTVNSSRLKPITEVVDNRQLLQPSLMDLARWISEKYVCPLGNVIETVVPSSIRDKAGTRKMLFANLSLEYAADPESFKVTKLQKQVLAVLAASSQALTPKELAETVGCTQAPISTLRRRGIIVTSERRVQQKTHEIPMEKREADWPLNPDQQRAYDSIAKTVEAGLHETFLMLGITGSGKTEVYIRAIQKVVEFGRQAIVLVPEISLTPQTRQRFRARFDQVAVLHSHLSAAERAWHWQQIAAGKVQVIVGARSAVFAPVPDLGVIILDEEHDGSFKQDKAPRYHARDVANWRAKKEKVPLILGSATPSMESYRRAIDDDYQLLSLPNRVLDLPLPDVATIDMRVDYANRKSVNPISQKLRQEIRQALGDDGQVILLLNRRGYATRIQCPGCGHVIYCPDCAIPMTHHRQGSKLVCHFCDHQTPEPNTCPECAFAAIKFAGLGTQKLEQYIHAMFPDVPCVRMDTDTMKRPGSHEEALARFRKGETKILLGTQMIAKGLDFPNVTLVGVINADSALHFPDFRAAERTFGLVTQVAGRSGRGPKGGRVLVQTFSPDHPAIVAATRHDYVAFAQGELPMRRQVGFPPYGQLARVVVRSPSEALTEQMGENIGEVIQKVADELGTELSINGPAPAPVEKLRGRFRYHLLIQAALDVDLQPVIKRATSLIKPVDDVQWIVDIDPQDML